MLKEFMVLFVVEYVLDCVTACGLGLQGKWMGIIFERGTSIFFIVAVEYP